MIYMNKELKNKRENFINSNNYKIFQINNFKKEYQ